MSLLSRRSTRRLAAERETRREFRRRYLMTRKSSDVLWELGGLWGGEEGVQGLGVGGPALSGAVTLAVAPPGCRMYTPSTEISRGQGKIRTETTNMADLIQETPPGEKRTIIGGDDSTLRRCSAVILGAAARAPLGPVVRIFGEGREF